MSISWFAFTFYIDDKIDCFISTIGNNDVLYAVDFGEKIFCSLPDQKILPKNEIEEEVCEFAYNKYGGMEKAFHIHSFIFFGMLTYYQVKLKNQI